MTSGRNVALLHGAGYAGGELIEILIQHPEICLSAVTSRSFSNKPVWHPHPSLRRRSQLSFSNPETLDLHRYDGILIAAEHGQSAAILAPLIQANYKGVIVDLSADFRLNHPALYEKWYRFEHPAPELLDRFIYGLPEVNSPYPEDTRWIANPGCFATGISLALWPVVSRLPSSNITVNALTGASGSGASPKSTTHFPTRDGNVRAYKILNHQHLPEILQIVGHEHNLAFTPISGPWTRGIWGTAHISIPASIAGPSINSWYEQAYSEKPFIRLWPGELPELRYTTGTPYCDIGWVISGKELIIGFSIDNLLKGAASQAIQNLNLLFGLPETLGLQYDTQKTTF